MPGVYGTIRGSILYIYYLLPCKYHSCIKEYYRKSQYAVSCVPRKQSMPQGARAKIFLSRVGEGNREYPQSQEMTMPGATTHHPPTT